MIKFMDGIVEAVEEFARAGAECMVFIFEVLAKWFIIITTPVWILPYKLIRDIVQDRNGGKCESPDCDSCPFPPCQKGAGGHD